MTADDPDFRSALALFDLPASMADRADPVDRSEVDRLLIESRQQVERENRHFHLGLVIAFLGVVERVCDTLEEDVVPDALIRYPPLAERNGRRVNTLTIPLPGARPVGLRYFYNVVESAVRFSLGRRGYPSMAPHATQAWAQHRAELETIFAMDPRERKALAQGLWQEVLRLPRPAYRTADEARPRPFTTILREFFAAPGEPAGVVLQALGFAYFNVELAHLTSVECDKVRTGGARRGNVGDIDGWSGSDLVIAIEVKDLDLDEESEHEVGGFLANLVNWPDTTAIVLANTVSPGVVGRLADTNIHTVTRQDLIRRTALWDMDRQEQALRSLEYYVIRVQAHDALSARFLEYLADREIELDTPRSPHAPPTSLLD